MLKNRQISRICRKKYKSRFKTAPQYAVTNPAELANPFIWTAFTTYLESLWSPAATTAEKAGMSYVYDEDGTLIADTLVGGATTAWGQNAKYIYLPTASGPMPVALVYGSKHYAIQSDHLNTPRRLVQSDGQVAWQWAYGAFGEEKPTIAKNRFANTDLNQSFGSTNVAAVTFNLRYPGQYFDVESGLHYNLNRSYSATLGRYTQSDPIDLQGGWNRFGYVGGNPLSNIDSLGLQGRTGGAYLPRGSAISGSPTMATNNGVGTTQSIMNQFTNLPNPAPLPGDYVGINYPWTMPNLQRICVRCATPPENMCHLTNDFPRMTATLDTKTCQCVEWRTVVVQ